MTYLNVESALADLFAPFAGRVDGTVERMQKMRALHQELLPLMSAAIEAGGEVNERGQLLLEQMRGLIRDQTVAAQKARVWHPNNTPWCPRHWQILRDGIDAGTHDPGRAGTALMGKWIEVLAKNGLVTNVPNPGRLQALRAEHAPLCCWLGDDKMVEVYALALVPDIEPCGE